MGEEEDELFPSLLPPHRPSFPRFVRCASAPPSMVFVLVFAHDVCGVVQFKFYRRRGGRPT